MTSIDIEHEADLVRRAQAGEKEAFGELYSRCSASATNLAMRLLGVPEEVEDALHSAFLTAYEKLAQLREAHAFRGWLRRILINEARKRLRRRNLNARLGLGGESKDAPLERCAQRSCPLESRAALARLDAHLRRMPSDERICWILHRVEGYTIDEIVELTDMSRSTIQRRVERASQRIEKRMLVEVA